MSALTGAVRGAVAGAVGTLAMDLLWYYRFRKGGGTQPFAAWETASGLQDYDRAPDPGKVVRTVYHAATGQDPPAGTARAATNAMHWATGTGWAALYGVLQPHSPRPELTAAGFGPAVWLSSYVMLPALQIYKPIWTYDATTLWRDLSAHLVYGALTAGTERLLRQ